MDGSSAIGFDPGYRPVVLSAPHAAVHVRCSVLKEEEEYTAGLARMVANLSGAHALYLRRRSCGDPSWDAVSPYKRRLKRIVAEHRVKFVLDIHGMAPERPLAVAVGTMGGRSCPEHRNAIVGQLESAGFRRNATFPDRLDVDQTFTGRGVTGQVTVARYVAHQLGICSAQIELHPLLRVVERREDASLPGPFWGDPARIRRLVDALVRVVGLVA